MIYFIPVNLFQDLCKLKKLFAKFVSVKESRESGVGYIRHAFLYK